MQPAPPAVTPEDSVEATFQKIVETEAQTVPVLQDGRLIGLITLKNIGEFVMLRSAVERLLHEDGSTPIQETIGRRRTPQSGAEGVPPRSGWLRPGRRARS